MADNLVRLGMAITVIAVITLALYHLGSRGASAFGPPPHALIKR